MGAGPVLSARGLTIGRGGAPLVRSVDLDLRPGELVAVLGPNGAGKSTLLATLAGLLAPLDGELRRSGRVAAALQAPALARRSVQANLEAALGWWGIARSERPARARVALERLQAGHLAERRADTLSGGEARRVHLARAVALEAEVLLLDEPFAGLDAPSRAGLLRDAAAVLRDPGRATLVVLHDRAEAWALADRLLVLLDGEVAAAGPPREVLDRPPSRAVAEFLGFTGHLRDAGGVRCLRPAHVVPDPDGRLVATVRSRIPEEDTVVCVLDLDGGELQMRVPHPGPLDGDVVRVRVDGGVVYEDRG